ncbi:MULTISPECIES: ABC transporter substrate-binding protein [Cupriavidus]|uniref:ABC transporter substrate-binding protein n=1 Tax=Cupriavidus oxalaticus TaxID=96344 RepID=A0A4P7LKS2_9BURK|nr:MULTISPECIES: ABC transporter substrate-binding protein [Cupriavidus]QBY54113.1 ABC transporter substrate-binding protein [Cupriavidus oxalaticus]TDF67804.1 ABC transporter substrate-binding protein [Cupriavidus sp. L7L]
MPKLPRLLPAIVLSTLLGASAAALADIRVGIDVSTTGPAASIGIPSKNTVLMWPQTLGGQKAHYVILDDGSDPAAAVRNVRKLISEEKVDVIVGPNITPTALAALDAVSEGETPMVALAASASIVEPQTDAKRRWAFKMPQNDSHMATVLTEYMSNHGIRTVGFIGFADAYGESWWREFSRLAEVRKIKVVANERFSRNDTSVTGQVLKLMAANPDAVLIAGAGTPSVLPQKTLGERGYKGKVYQTHGIATWEFLRMGGKDVEGTLFPTGPVVVARQLPENHPVRKVALDFVNRYEGKYGADSVTQFAGDAWGAWLLLDDAARRALKTGAQPGTREFRAAMRDALESTTNLTIPNGVLNLNAKDHQGFDQRSRVMGVIRNGKFAYAGDK